jgi:hypothetical protein
MSDTTPRPPLGASSFDEEGYWEERLVETMLKMSILEMSILGGLKAMYLGKMRVPSGKGGREACIFQAGRHIIAIDNINGCLLNVGSGNITWHYSTIAENGNINEHIKAMVNHCKDVLKPEVYQRTLDAWNS